MPTYPFTDHVQKALAMAREEALRSRHDYLGPEHLLLGVLRLGDPQVERVLAERGLVAKELAGKVAARLAPGTAEVSGTKLPYTSRAKSVLAAALDSARARRVPGVGVLELLAGLLREERGVAAEVLREAGLTPAAVGPAGVGPAGQGEASTEKPLVVLDDRSDRSIYEQIVEQVQERVAVGELAPGERLPTVRRLADRLDIAPGTVARAYGELERLGLVVTQGARGTRVAERERSAVPDGERAETLAGLLRPVAVAAFHLGATSAELRRALEAAMADIFSGDGSDGGDGEAA